MTFPMITRSGLALSMFSGAYGVNTSIPQSRNMSLMGGYTFSSLPVTE